MQAVMDIITVNSRMPDFLVGDVWAAIASVRIGAKRLGDLAEKYGVETFDPRDGQLHGVWRKGGLGRD